MLDYFNVFIVVNNKRKYSELNKLIKKCGGKDLAKRKNGIRVINFVSQGVQTVADKGVLFDMKKLCMFIGSENSLTSFPPVFSFSATLTVLNLDGNKITEVPPEISALSHLKVLSRKKSTAHSSSFVFIVSLSR